MTKKQFTKIIAPFFILSFTIAGPVSAASLKSDITRTLKASNLIEANQAICMEGVNSLSINKDALIIPASVSKVYTFDFALSKLPTDFRYTTTFILNKNTLYINGSGDQFFVIEHLIAALDEIMKEKKVTIDTIVFSPGFYFNWNQSPTDVGFALSSAITKNTTLPFAKKVTVLPANTPYTGKGKSYQFSSAPLITLLKQTNNWSTNITADALFTQLGGSSAFAAYMKDTYGADNKTVSFQTGSGLRGNYTTCGLTLKVLQHLEKTLQEKGFAITDVLSIPNVDEGVLKNRDINTSLTNAIAAKSGFVNYNHTLAGSINTTKGTDYFGIFLNYEKLVDTEPVKKTVEAIARELQAAQKKILKSYDYTIKPYSIASTDIKKL